MEAEEKEVIEEDIVDDNLVSFFDLLAQFDFEDQKKAGQLSPESLKK